MTGRETMAIYNNSFDSYQLILNTDPFAYKAEINLFLGTTFTGRIVIYADGNTTITNQEFQPGGTNYKIPMLAYPLSRMGEIMNFLRFEKPLFISLDTVSNRGYLATREREAVGEQEGV
jgi:hypothetical protein